jgi:hypothetical protein
MEHPLDSLSGNSKIDPVKLLRNIKYKNGRLLNLKDRTYTNDILIGIVKKILDRIGFHFEFKIQRFASSKISKKNKFVLLIFILGAFTHHYFTQNDSKKQTVLKFLRKRVREYYVKSYQELLPSEADFESLRKLAKKEVKATSVEKLMYKYLHLHCDEQGMKYETVHKQLKDLKRSKYDNKENKLTSFEPNTVLTFLVLGYMEYQCQYYTHVAHSVPDIIDCINDLQVSYLNFGTIFMNKIRALSRPNCLQVKHISDTVTICKPLKYLLNDKIAFKIKPYVMNL